MTKIHSVTDKDTENQIKQLNNISVEELDITDYDHKQIEQKFMTRIVKPMSDVFAGDFSVIFSMFCVIPVHFHIYNIDIEDASILDDNIIEEIKDRTELTFDSIPLSSAYCCVNVHRREIEIHISFFKKRDVELKTFIDKIINYHARTLGFIYMHEIMHIFNRDLESFDAHIQTAQRLFKEKHNEEISKQYSQQFCNIACDFHINSTLLRKNQVFNDGSFVNFILYSQDYNSDNMSVYDILENVIETAEVNVYSFGDCNSSQSDNGSGDSSEESGSDDSKNNETDGEKSKNNSGKNKKHTGKIIVSKTKAGKKVDIDLDGEIIKGIDEMENDGSNTDGLSVSDIIGDVVNDMVTKVRGLGSNNVLSQLGIPLAVKMNWARKLRRRMAYLCGEKKQRDETTWTNPNIYYKHIATLPGPIKRGKMPKIYILVDSSGSMSNEELRKINYILKELNTKGFPIITIIHDYSISRIDRFEAKSKHINNFIQYRYSCGGTSHEDVFNYIENELTNRKEYKKSIVLIASDMYSDIDQIYKNYKWIKHVSTIGLAFGRNNNYQLPFGETIDIE
jgi:hypothetical protein